MHWLDSGGGKVWSHQSVMWPHQTNATVDGLIQLQLQNTLHALHIWRHTTSCSMQIYCSLPWELSPVSVSHNKKGNDHNRPILNVTWNQFCGDGKKPIVCAEWKMIMVVVHAWGSLFLFVFLNLVLYRVNISLKYKQASKPDFMDYNYIITVCHRPDLQPTELTFWLLPQQLIITIN